MINHETTKAAKAVFGSAGRNSAAALPVFPPQSLLSPESRLEVLTRSPACALRHKCGPPRYSSHYSRRGDGGQLQRVPHLAQPRDVAPARSPSDGWGLTADLPVHLCKPFHPREGGRPLNLPRGSKTHSKQLKLGHPEGGRPRRAQGPGSGSLVSWLHTDGATFFPGQLRSGRVPGKQSGSRPPRPPAACPVSSAQARAPGWPLPSDSLFP